MATVHQVTQENNSLSQRIERKFYVVPGNIEIAYALLRQFCRLDNDYPKEQIHN